MILFEFCSGFRQNLVQYFTVLLILKQNITHNFKSCADFLFILYIFLYYSDFLQKNLDLNSYKSYIAFYQTLALNWNRLWNRQNPISFFTIYTRNLAKGFDRILFAIPTKPFLSSKQPWLVFLLNLIQV